MNRGTECEWNGKSFNKESWFRQGWWCERAKEHAEPAFTTKFWRGLVGLQQALQPLFSPNVTLTPSCWLPPHSAQCTVHIAQCTVHHLALVAACRTTAVHCTSFLSFQFSSSVVRLKLWCYIATSRQHNFHTNDHSHTGHNQMSDTLSGLIGKKKESVFWKKNL